MKSLIWKEWREHLKWVPLPGLVILLVFSIEKPEEPMPWSMVAYYYCLTAVVFAAALGFLQIIFEAHGDKRSLLLHRPLYPSRIFLAKALAGVSLYLLALGIPFVCLETWMARPGNMPAPYHWRMSLPWLADILSGLVYYFAGMLMAQRSALVRQPGFGSGRSLLLLLPGLDTSRILASARSDRDHRVDCGRGGVGQLLGRRRVCQPAAAGQGRPGDDLSGGSADPEHAR